MRSTLFVATGLAAATLLILSATAPAGGGPQQVTVNLSDFKIAGATLRSAQLGKPSALEPGQTAFTFRNRGKFPHNFVIVAASKGASKLRTSEIAPGKSARLSLNLKAGAYLAVCTVFNGAHFAAGMVRPFTVGTQAQDGSWGP
jgi:plastocyanin